MTNVKQHLDMLGLRVRDKVTGFSGVVASVCFDLYGCIQAGVNPGMAPDGKLMDAMWFDIARLSVIDARPVMDTPNFEFGAQAEGRQGPAEKPQFMKP
jgi:hypothetical protein